ncbi:MAG: hypothetical protein H0T79_04655 [Deltaproteobacteria bacterium]|nr:hypothetical protein [Deltaproteobacteria bacterium]
MMQVAMLVVVLHAACAPTVEGPAQQQRGLDREDETRLAAQLAALPGATTAKVTLHRPTRDPLSTLPASAPTAAVLVVIDASTDRARVLATARTLVRATAPEIPEPTIVVEVGAPRIELTRVGPFAVAAASRGPLRATLAIAFVIIAGLALAIAWRYRRGNSAQ